MRTSGSFGRMLNARPGKRALVTLCIVWLAFLLLPLFLLAAYVYPAHDDFPNAMLALEAWIGTGSVFEVIRAAWRQAVADYYQWQGTFAAMFLCALQPMVFSMDLLWVSPVVTIALLSLSAGYLCRQIARYILGSDSAAALVLSTALITLLVFSAPGVKELFYWHAAVQYTFSLIVMMLLSGLLIKLHQPQGKGVYAVRALMAALLAFVLGALPYTHALGGAVAMALIAVWCIRRRSPAAAAAIAGFAAILVSLIIVIIAPGNAMRQSASGESLHPVLAVAHSLKACLCSAAGWFGPEWPGLALVLVPLLWPLLRKCTVRFGNPAWFSFFSFGVLAACYVPPIFATGVDSWHLPRIEGSLYMLWSLLAFLNLLYWLGWAAKRFDIPAGGRARVMSLLVCAVLVVAGAFAGNAPFATPTLGAWKSVLSGEAARYRSEMAQRQQAILEAGTLDEARAAVEPLSVQPILLPLDELIYQKKSRLPGEMHIFFEAQRLAEEYGRGNVPAEMWEQLQTWMDH